MQIIGKVKKPDGLRFSYISVMSPKVFSQKLLQNANNDRAYMEISWPKEISRQNVTSSYSEWQAIEQLKMSKVD